MMAPLGALDGFAPSSRFTENGARTALCYNRTYARVMKPAMAVSFDRATRSTSQLRRVIDALDH